MTQHDQTVELRRIADATERIATALEAQRPASGGVTLKLDGKYLVREVVRETLSRAARGPSSLIGGSLREGEK